MQKWDMQTVRELSHVDLGMNSSAVHFFVMCDAFYNVTIFAQRVCLKGERDETTININSYILNRNKLLLNSTKTF